MNTTTCRVLVVDGARARWFELDLENPRLDEHSDMVNPEHQLHGEDKYTDTKSGRVPNTHAQPRSFDDHRNAHELENERRFARQVAAQTQRIALEQNDRQWIVVAAPKMRGILREELVALEKLGCELTYVTKDVSKCRTASEIHTLLAAEGLVPSYVRKTQINAHTRRP